MFFFCFRFLAPIVAAHPMAATPATEKLYHSVVSISGKIIQVDPIYASIIQEIDVLFPLQCLPFCMHSLGAKSTVYCQPAGFREGREDCANLQECFSGLVQPYGIL